MRDEEKVYSTYDVHSMAEERCGRKLSNYELDTLIACWRIKQGIHDGMQDGFTLRETADFLAYIY